MIHSQFIFLILPLYRICFAVTRIFAGISRSGIYERASAEFSITLFLVNLNVQVHGAGWENMFLSYSKNSGRMALYLIVKVVFCCCYIIYKIKQ